MPSETPSRLIVVSNRLPVRVGADESGGRTIRVSPGGLVTALTPVLEKQGGTWIGWVGDETDPEVEQLVEEQDRKLNYDIVNVPITAEEEDAYYRGFSNETIWPLFHDLLGYAKFERSTWDTYLEINERFAQYAAEAIQSPNDIIWVQDYQLLMVAHHLRRMGVENPIAHFLHIPFPSPDLFRRLPWRMDILRGMTKYDLLGFHTMQDRRNFVEGIQDLMPNARVEAGRRITSISMEGGRAVKVGHFPISIDFKDFSTYAASQEVMDEAWYFHEHFDRRTIILGVDRLDYTKGIRERIYAFERFLEKYPDMRGKVCLYQVVIPSRDNVPDYQNLKETLDQLVGRINGRFTQAGYVPIHYMYRSLTRRQLLGRYRACEVALITPLRDGMNLVCKEFVASKVDNEGVLILSEFAGAATQLAKGALIVNPFDQEQVVDALYRAVTMAPEERRQRMERLRAEVRRNDVHRWVNSILGTLQDMGAAMPAAEV